MNPLPGYTIKKVLSQDIVGHWSLQNNPPSLYKWNITKDLFFMVRIIYV